jgi:predicted O-linked N-acetylglucosamine transferase (SPINDLY family)
MSVASGPTGLAEAALGRGDLPAALRHVGAALAADPAHAPAWLVLSRLYLASGQASDAVEAARRAVAVAPGDGGAHLALAHALHAAGEAPAAVDASRHALAAGADPIATHLAMASAALDAGDPATAVDAAATAAALAPNDPTPRFVHGSALAALGRHADAAVAFSEATRLRPDWAWAHANLGHALAEDGRHAEAERAFADALALDPGLPGALSQRVFLKRRLCNWEGIEASSAALRRLVAERAAGVTPFSFLAEPASGAEQRRCAETWAAGRLAAVEPLRRRAPPTRAIGRSGPIRVGLVSSGFHNHPTALLVVELIERLRGGPIEVIGLATSADDGGALRARLAGACRHFEELPRHDPVAMAHRVVDLGIDVLVDLRGYGGGAVTELFALRPAPVQVNWLAYPGTSGASFIDYLLADRIVVPEASRADFSEAVVWLPHCFQPSDTTRPVGVPPPRAALGLPSDGCVFASFNNGYKITPEVHADWMAILDAVPGSVLWLLAPGAEAETRLRASTERAGVDPARLVFQPKRPHLAYLALYRHADLFLDTRPYGAHTTASDALWAGCPLLTLPGDTFASRVGASLLRALGLEDLIARDREEYRRLAIALGRDGQARAALRSRLDAARRSAPLFDMGRYAEDFTRAIGAMADRARRGESPRDIVIAD